jgi:hypothetical protein
MLFGMPDAREHEGGFQGFVVPEQNWFRLPNEWTNITSGIKSLAELKVIEYVLRHTWGFQEYGIAKQISASEFMHGRRRQDGSRLDRGTGLSKPSVIEGLRLAVAHGYLIEARDERDKGRIQKEYRLRMRDLNSGVKILNRGVKNLHTSGEESLPRTEKDTVERNITTVNGDKTTTSLVRQLPDLKQPPEKSVLIAQDILAALGDEHSARFYRLVAAKIPAEVIYQTLGEIKADGAENAAKVFTYRMNRYALERLQT